MVKVGCDPGRLPGIYVDSLDGTEGAMRGRLTPSWMSVNLAPGFFLLGRYGVLWYLVTEIRLSASYCLSASNSNFPLHNESSPTAPAFLPWDVKEFVEPRVQY
ncbi:hypothetical protein BDM02DRAFT_3108964 [Thelephora ganbajun]|uniref:Uncharacterized protein n=1 Tax=Thelephora ganbajun TaxID=370292 RepID=A0ACB6ZTF9_THEGA|nr:hypothetical protein BDM02DRAFT_3108964 [Thelephora ganbajun]